MDFETWLQTGYENGWVGPPICETHDGLPLSEREDNTFIEADPCIHILRLYESKEHKKEVEDNHSPSIWRAVNQGRLND